MAKIGLNMAKSLLIDWLKALIVKDLNHDVFANIGSYI